MWMPDRPAPRRFMILLAELLSVQNTVPNIFTEVKLHAFRTKQDLCTFDSCVELQHHPISSFEKVVAVRKDELPSYSF